MFDTKPDYDACRKRMDAWWHGEIIDRTAVSIRVAKPERLPAPASHHANVRERWMDVDYASERARVGALNTIYVGEAFPIAWPNLGPEVFTAFFGAELEYGETTSWSAPLLEDWADADRVRFDPQNPYFLKMQELTEAFIDKGRGTFITGVTDFHPGGDHLAALRDPQRLAVDLIERPDDVKRLLQRMEGEYFKVYDIFYRRLRREGLPISTWLPAVADGRYNVPSNDFSCMVSNAMFREFFLEGIANECRFLDYSIYHLDGPGALQHLDSLLAIPELNAIQFVAGAGRGGFTEWVQVYQRIQRAGKAFVIYPRPDELSLVFETLRPEGCWLDMGGVKGVDEAEAVVKRVARWA